MTELKLPELGESIENAEVSRLLVAEGDEVMAGQNVVELESDKASFPLPCPSAGRVSKIHVKVGDSVSVGQTVLEVEGNGKAPAKDGQPAGDGKKKPAPTDGKSAPQKPAEPAAKEPAKPPAEEKLPAGTDEDAVAAGPATRRLARELGVNLNDVAGSERGGRITPEDVKAFVKQRLTQPAERGVEAPAPVLPDFSRFGPVRRQPLGKIARVAAQRLSTAWRVAPHVTQHDWADVTDLEAGRRRFNEANRDTGPKITMTALAIRAAVIALRAFPQFNSSLDTSANELIVKDYRHIGVAVDTEHGLLVPVLRDADRKTLVQLAAELADVADKARKHELALTDMEGGTFTITNLGGIGGAFFTPILNYPEVAILGIGQAETCAPASDGPDRLRLPLSLSYDHRVINGADGARFIRKLTALFGDPFQLLAES